MTFVPSFQFDNVEITLATDPPFILNESPADLDVDVLVGTTISFRVEDPNDDIDLTTLAASIEDDLGNLTNMVVAGVAQAGYSLATTPVTNGHDVVITPDDDLAYFTIYTVSAEISDLQPVQGTSVWSFSTEDGPLDGPTLVASPISNSIKVTWSVIEGMRADEFVVRRSETSAPTAVDQGDLFYQGPDTSSLDTDVEFDITYFYSVFVIRRFESGVPNYYEPYDERASDDATLVTRILPVVRGVEYVPVAGEMGTVVNPFLAYSVSTAYGDRLGGDAFAESDSYIIPAGQALRCPSTCTVSKIRNNADNELAYTVEMISDKFTFIIDGIIVASGIIETSQLTVGQILGRSTGQNVSFQIFRNATEAHGKRVVRPSRFFVRTEDRQ
jgi:hypothetical protein